MTAEKVEIKFNEDELTLGDLEDFEDAAGIGLFEALKAKPVIDPETGRPERDEKGRPVTEVQLSAKSLKALVWVVLRAERPGFSLDDARNIKVTSLVLGGGDESPEGKDESASVESS